jgi:hypothetical protein
MPYHDRRHVVRDRIVDAEVMKLERRNAHLRAAQVREATEAATRARRTPAGVGRKPA